MAQRPVPREHGEALKTVSFRYPISRRRQLSDAAAAAGMSASDWIRQVVDKALASEEEAA